MDSLSVIWLAFAGCATTIATGGILLSRYGDIIARRTGLSGSWIGLVLLATVTSMPELVTGISSVTVADEPNIALGDILGSCVFNLAILVVVDFLYRRAPIYTCASHGHILSAAFGCVLIGVAASGILLAPRLGGMTIGWIGLGTPLLVLLYAVAMRTVFVYERRQAAAAAADEDDGGLTLRQAALRYAGAAALVVGAGVWLPFVGAMLAEAMGWHKTFVGTLFVAAVTSLPEAAATIGALRVGALDMAIANLLGSNLFNMVILAIDDLFYLRGPLLSHVSPMHAVSAVSAMVMSGLVIVGLLSRPASRPFRLVGWTSIGLLTIYLLNSMVLYLHE